MKSTNVYSVSNDAKLVRKFIAYFHFVGWDCFSLGFHVCISQPNIEIHIPFGFIRIGWTQTYDKMNVVSCGPKRTWGLTRG